MMQKTARIFTVLALLGGVAQAAGDELKFAEHGFSIKPLKGHNAKAMQQVLTLSLSPSDGFAPNVNVQVQPFTGTMEEYLDISRNDFQKLGFTTIQVKIEGNVAVLEYSGSLPKVPMALHWYARAVQAPGKVYLVTGTAAETQWAQAGAAIKECVDSLKIAR
jgi:hypothetical protein